MKRYGMNNVLKTQFGHWSAPLETLSGPGVPDPPSHPSLISRSAHSIAISWNEPANNGSQVMEYRIEVASNLKKSCSNGSLDDVVNEQAEGVDFDHLSFVHGHSGAFSHHEFKGLQPITTYFFRIQVLDRTVLCWVGLGPIQLFCSTMVF